MKGDLFQARAEKKHRECCRIFAKAFSWGRSSTTGAPGSQSSTAHCRYPLDAPNKKRLFKQGEYHNGLVSPASKSLCKLPDECWSQRREPPTPGLQRIEENPRVLLTLWTPFPLIS